MAIKIIFNKGIAEPTCICDFCEEKISDAREGNYYWHWGRESTSDIYYLHKKCSRAFEHSNPLPDNGVWSWDELKRLPFCLIANTNVLSEKSTLALFNEIFHRIKKVGIRQQAKALREAVRADLPSAREKSSSASS